MLKAFRKKEGQKGFTLIELMIVIAIIGILAAIAIPQFAAYRVKSYNTKAQAELKSYYTACQAYVADNPTAADCSLATLAGLSEGGFVPSDDVTITPAGATACTGTTSVHDSTADGVMIYTLSANGNISGAARP